MKNIFNSGCRSAIVILALFISSNLQSQDETEGTLTFTIETISNGGHYSPKHVLAIWIEDGSGFVKTRKLRGSERKKYLYTWNDRTSQNTVDAITGSTLKSHQSHTLTWDGTDVNGNVVPDGDYKVRVEFTDEHAQGPLYSLTFSKGKEEVALSPANSGKFKDISLLWAPAEVAAPEAGFSFAVNDLEVTFSNTSSNAESYNWDFGDSNTSSESDPVHVYSAEGTYQVILEASSGDVANTATQEVTVTDAVTFVVEKEGLLKVFPNPAEGNLIVEHSAAENFTSYAIISLEGRSMRHGSITGASQFVIHLDQMESGTYVLKLQGPEKEHSVPFVKK